MEEAGTSHRRASEQLRLGQRRLLLLRRRQGLVLAMLRKRAAGGQEAHHSRRRRRRGLQVHATMRWCGASARKPRLPSPGEFAALQAHRQRSRRRRRALRLKEMKERELARQRGQWKARQRVKRRLKHERQEGLERKAARRIARALREDAEAAAAHGVGDSTVGSLVARPIMAPPPGRLQPWAAAPRVKCESASALVQQTLRASQLLPPEAHARTGLYDHMLIVGLPLESLREPAVQLGGTYAPQVVYTFPEGVLAAESVADFCLPQGVTVTRIDPATGQPQPRPPSPGGAPPPLPSGVCSRQRNKLAAAALEEAKEVLFVLSGGGADGSETSYGMCLHVRRPYLFSDRVAARADICYCFVAKRPFLSLHLGVLRELVRLHLFPPAAPTPTSDDPWGPASPPSSSSSKGMIARPLLAELEREKQAVLRITRALHRLAVLPVPAPGKEVSFNVFEGMPQALAVPTYFRRPPLPKLVAAAWGAPVAVEDEDEATRLVREWAAPVLLSLLGLERVLMVALSMLTEVQVVVVSPEPQVLSACVLALATLVRPLVWAGPLIATLPQRHSEYLDSPVPLIVGVEALPHGFQAPQGMVLVYPERDAIAFHPSEAELYPQLLGHQVAWLLRSLRDAQRRLRLKPKQQPQPVEGGNDASTAAAANVIFPPPRALSPAYGNAAPRPHDPHQQQQQHSQPPPSWCGGVLEPEEEARRGELRLHTRPAPLTAEQQRQRQRRRQPDPRAVEEVVRRLRQHVAALAEAALSIDLVHRPRRPVLDRRRSALVEEKALEPEMQAWWQECLGMESGALFMQRFMDTQMYANHRYSDAIRKRDLNVAMGADAFSPKYRPLASFQHSQNPPHLETIGVDTWSLPPDPADQAQPQQQQHYQQQPSAAENEAPLPHEGGLTELFTMALSGGTAARSVAEEFSYEALVPLAEAGLLHRPCNGLCEGRCDTEDCTDICLELWHHRLVHLRRREIVRGHRSLAPPHSRPYSAPWRPAPTAPRSPRHRLEVPSQYRRRLLLAHGDEVLSRCRRLREKGRNALRFQLLLQMARERQRVERHAGLVILGALRRHHARCQMARVSRGVVQLQAAWRGYRRRQQIRAFRLIQWTLRRYVHRFRLQRWRAAEARALTKQREEEAAAVAAASLAAAATARGSFAPLSSPTGSPGGAKSPGSAKAASSPSSGGGLWQYLKKRRDGARSPSPKLPGGNSAQDDGNGQPMFFLPSPPPSGYEPYAHRPVSPAMSPATAQAASPASQPQSSPAAPAVATAGSPPPHAAISPAGVGPLSPHPPAGPTASSPPLAVRPVSPPAKSHAAEPALCPSPSPSSPLGMLFSTSPPPSTSPAQQQQQQQQQPKAPVHSPAVGGGGGHSLPKLSLLPTTTAAAGITSPLPSMASPAPPSPSTPAPSPPRPHVRNQLISPAIRASLPVVSVPEYGSGGIREEEEEANSLRSRSKAGALAASSPVRPVQEHHHKQPHRPPTGAGEGMEGPGADGEEQEDGGVVDEEEDDGESGAAVVVAASSSRPPRLLAESLPSIGRQLVPSEKGPLPLSALRKGLRVRKLDRNGRPHRRLFRLEDQGSLAYAPRLAWRPLGVAARALRAMLQSGKPCTLTLSEAVGGVDSSGKTPRTIMALTHKPPLLRPVPGSDPPRYLVFAINDGDHDVVEFELCVGRRLVAEEAIEYYMRLLGTLQTLCAQAAPPQSPSTPKP